jgi:hypothetical protein
VTSECIKSASYTKTKVTMVTAGVPGGALSFASHSVIFPEVGSPGIGAAAQGSQ